METAAAAQTVLILNDAPYGSERPFKAQWSGQGGRFAAERRLRS